ncbi:MAG: hypothetical protein KJP02_08005 [Octadecabacter sp.]|nr:hypothetical protein [Octadecabacter sp.]
MLVVSCAAISPLLVIFVLSTPGFVDLLGQNATARSRFFRQVLTNGLPVVLVLNYFSFFMFALLTEKGMRRSAVLVLVADLPVRVAAFFVLHAIIYVLSAQWFGSFRGDRLQALQVVGPTLARAAGFDNISGVFLYATLVGALPLYVVALGQMLGPWLPQGGKARAAVLALLAILAIALSAAVTTGVAYLIAVLIQ